MAWAVMEKHAHMHHSSIRLHLDKMTGGAQMKFVAVTTTCALCRKDASAGVVVYLAWCLVQVRPKGPRTRGWSGINSYLTPVALVTRNLGLLESPNNVLGRPSRVRVNAVAHRSGWFPVGQGQKGRSGKMGGLRGDAAQSRLERHHSAAVGPALFPLLRTAAPFTLTDPPGTRSPPAHCKKAHLPTVQLFHRQHKAVLVLPDSPRKKAASQISTLGPCTSRGQSTQFSPWIPKS
ncbi:hypothetical protein GGP41_002198 [Bipolaris sorokiniana]|uniref:Uncharacterized protein n=2 Tax=Cochliobolus sativus TaxID=45130 RepID=A0A8H5ZQR3_COCSA|nr:uncharacterized protein COCSADRAFT_342474 [Bipolaris sorokiniana ND90Pr]EMD62270.1 hypothetical protein COCSADRAFT_342474 [Bipolaris sorokiniana ND90Pr]KAF5853647.1 hypothetical protein GGP41_002198 [Bipolaris sorokiniana]